MIKEGDKVILDGVEYVIKEIKGNDVLLVKRDDALNIMFMNEKTLYAKLYEQQKQKINSLKTEILIINNDAVNSGDEAQMEITGRVIEALENTIVDDWRVEE